MVRTRNLPDFLKVLNSALSENPFYVELFNVIGNVIDEQIGEPLAQLARVRSSTHIKRGDYLKHTNGEVGKVAQLRRIHIGSKPFDEITLQLNSGMVITQTRRALQDRKTLIDSANFSGFTYYSDYLKDEDLARITDYVNAYWPKSGDPEFIQFIGFVKSLALSMETLWTKDKGDNATSDDPEISKYDSLEVYQQGVTTSVTEGGVWYPTSHREINYDALLSATVDDDLILLFYMLAPINLVLERISGAINVNSYYTLIGYADLQLVESGYIKI